ncbi:MAG TPA: Na(+)/H(+) antiporter subunit C [Nonomuraea sp.]|uniref:Na(+)/H(+) antiporter subunit C n=1 Tax=Nonomuraea sp. NPDC049649 TaxID=3155776 RepID=UPI002C42146F|nr:Na(+)/H(+) antiporter subunit C [Nonomuraea sp.]
MTISLVPLIVCGLLVAAGVTLVLERSLVRVLVGVILMGNGVNLLIVTLGGNAGGPPLLGQTPPEEMADPLPQAMVLTAIVITLAVTAFLLAMVHRAWQLRGSDEVSDDTEDRWVRLRARRGELGERVRARQAEYDRLVAEQRAELREPTRGEQLAHRRADRRRLKARQREARKQMRRTIRAERERQALALDPELEGDE